MAGLPLRRPAMSHSPQRPPPRQQPPPPAPHAPPERPSDVAQRRASDRVPSPPLAARPAGRPPSALQPRTAPRRGPHRHRFPDASGPWQPMARRPSAVPLHMEVGHEERPDDGQCRRGWAVCWTSGAAGPAQSRTRPASVRPPWAGGSRRRRQPTSCGLPPHPGRQPRRQPGPGSASPWPAAPRTRRRRRTETAGAAPGLELWWRGGTARARRRRLARAPCCTRVTCAGSKWVEGPRV